MKFREMKKLPYVPTVSKRQSWVSLALPGFYSPLALPKEGCWKD